MAEVFTSYSRKDKDFVQDLLKEFEYHKRSAWVDWQDIPPTAKWLQEVFNGIETADNFVFVISPDSILSKVCGIEIDYAVKHNKRLIPLLYREVESEMLPEPIAVTNWILFNIASDFQQSMRMLLNALDTDLDHTRAHTELMVKAKEWDTYKNDTAYLLTGSQLEKARQWLEKASNKQPRPLPLHRKYIQTCIQMEQESAEQKRVRQKYLTRRDNTLKAYIRPFLKQRKEELDRQREEFNKEPSIKHMDFKVVQLEEELGALINFLDEGGRWHPDEPILVRELGADMDYLDGYEFPCCGKKVAAYKTPSCFSKDGCQPSPVTSGSNDD